MWERNSLLDCLINFYTQWTIRLFNLATENDKQIEFWLEQVKNFKNDTTISEQDREHQLKDLVEQIRDRLDDLKLNFSNAYVEDVMNRLTEIIGIDSLPD